MSKTKPVISINSNLTGSFPYHPIYSKGITITITITIIITRKREVILEFPFAEMIEFLCLIGHRISHFYLLFQGLSLGLDV